MYEIMRCFKCNETGHVKADCPMRRTPAAKAPVAAPSDEGGENRVKFKTGTDGRKLLHIDIPGWAPGPIADAHSWANRIRTDDPRLGRQHCGDPGDVYDSAARRLAGLHPVHLCVLRQIAAETLTPQQPEPSAPVSPEAARRAEAHLRHALRDIPIPPEQSAAPLPQWTDLPDDDPDLRVWLASRTRETEAA